MKNKKSDDLSKNFWYALAAISSILVILIGISFFLFSTREEEVIDKKIKGGNILLKYTNDITGLTISKATPVTDEIGMKNDKEGQTFDFSLEINLEDAKDIEYEISAIKNDSLSTIADDDIRVYLEKEKSGTYSKVFGPAPFEALKKRSKLGSPEDSMVLVKSHTTKDLKENYRLRLWLSNKGLTKTGNYSVEIVVNGKAK